MMVAGWPLTTNTMLPVDSLVTGPAPVSTPEKIAALVVAGVGDDHRAGVNKLVRKHEAGRRKAVAAAGRLVAPARR